MTANKPELQESYTEATRIAYSVFADLMEKLQYRVAK
jgi:hypothetical protein